MAKEQFSGGKESSEVVSYYEMLGVSPDVGDADLKTAFRALVMKEHPDQGGNPDAFRSIVHAYVSLVKLRAEKYVRDELKKRSNN